MNKKILVIHLTDKSTDFLKPIYKDLDCDIITDGRISNKELREQIKSHEQIIMLGHGLPYGLINVHIGGLIINYTHVDLLKEKQNNVYIWCNADLFVNQFKLNGFYSGMFISEVGEALFCGIVPKENDVVSQNHEFAKILGKYLNKIPLNETYSKIKEEYGLLIESNPIAEYNHQRLYFK